jgi:hypothetical protein
MAFDENHYKNIFEQRYGKGSFDSGLNDARQIGQLKVQASVAKKDYTARLKAAQKAAKAKKEAEDIGAKDIVNSFVREQQDRENTQVSNASLKATKPIKGAGTVGESYWASKGVPKGLGTTNPTPKTPDNKWVNPYTRDDLKVALAAIKKAKDTDTQESYSRKFNSVASAGANKGNSISAYDKMKSFAKKIDPSNTPDGTTRFYDTLQTKGYKKTIEKRQEDFMMDPVVSKQHDKYAKEQQATKKDKTSLLGILGKIGEIIDRPGDAVRTGIKEAKQGHSFFKGLEDGFTGKKNTSGTELNKALGFNPDKGKIANNIARMLARGFVSENPGQGLSTAAVGKKVSTKIGKATAGVASEIALDPLNLLGTGIAAKGIKGLGKLSKGTKVADELLGLPAPQLRLHSPQLQLPKPNTVAPSLEALNKVGIKPNGLQSPIPGMPKPMREAFAQDRLIKQGVNFGQGSKFAPKARPDLTPIETTIDPLKRGQAYWQTRYEDFAKFAKDSGYSPNNSSKESIQELWSRFAKYDEPVSIEQAVELAYPKGFEAPPVPTQSAQENPLITAMGNEPKPEPKISRPATFNEMIQHMKELAPPKQTPIEPAPLNFRVPKGFNPNLNSNILNRGNAQPSVLDGLKSIKPGKAKAGKGYEKVKAEVLPTPIKEIQKAPTKEQLLQENSAKMQALSDEYDRIIENPKTKNKQITDIFDSIDTLGKEKRDIIAGKYENISSAPKSINMDSVKGKAKVGKGFESISAAKNKFEAISAAPKGRNADITDPNPIDGHGYGLIDTQALSKDATKTLRESKDILPNQTLTKNVYELTSRLPKEMANKINAELDAAKSNHVNNLEQRTNDLFEKVVKGLGIDKGSKESALVQDYGEKTLAKNFLKKRGIDPSKVSEQELNNINLIQLKKIRPNDWQKIIEADKYIGTDYKKMIGEVNTTAKQIYPNNPDKIVPERKDYYHHFTDLKGFEGFKNLIKNSSSIDPHLAGVSPHTRPNSKWQAFKQMRGNGAYTSDAVGGYLKYLQAASHSTHIDPMVKVLRQSAEQIATATEGTKNLNNLKTALEVHADNLAGKTNPVDRLFQDHVIGRKLMQGVNLVNSHIKKNMILGNLGSALGQVGNVPLTMGKAKQFAPQGLMDTLGYTANHLLGGEKNLSLPINKSQFLKERFSSKYFTRFDNGLLKKPEKMAVWLLETADKAGTHFAWNSMYRKGLAKGVADPIKFADTETRHIIAGRGVGEVPIAQKAKVTQLVAPFTLEVGNQWKVLGKQMSEKDFAGVVTFLAASYGLNEVMHKLKGSDVSYNPVGAVVDGYDKTKGASLGKLKGAGASLLGETVGNIPGGNYIPQLLGMASPTTKQAFFGNRSPDRFGTGLGVASTVFKPGVDLVGGRGVKQAGKDLLPLAFPFGGNQIKKTVGGIEALAKGGSYDSKGNLQYPVNSNNKGDLLHSLLVGPTTTASGQDYYNNNRKPLSAKQTLQYQNAPNKQDYYNNLIHQRQINSIQTKIKDLQKDRKLTPREKQQNLLILIKELQNLQK